MFLLTNMVRLLCKAVVTTSDLWEEPHYSLTLASHQVSEILNEFTSLKNNLYSLCKLKIKLSFLILLASLLLQRSGDAELLQVLRPGDMAVYAVLAAAVRGPGIHPHLLHLLFFTCIQPLLPTGLLLIPRLPSLHLQRDRRERHTTRVSSQVSFRFKEHSRWLRLFLQFQTGCL